MFKILFTIVHVIVSIILVLVVLLQTGKRADLAGAFGGGGSGTAFGARGAATLLSKATTICAVMFMVTSLGLSILTGRGESGTTVLEDLPAPASTTPSTPGESGSGGTDAGGSESLPQLPTVEDDAAAVEDPVSDPQGTPLEDIETPPE